MRNHVLLLGRSLIERGAWFFAPFSWIFAAIVFLRNKLYDKKWLASHLVPCPVVSVGNLVAGGTGKTPFVLALSQAFSNRRVAVLSRGYGALPDEAMLLQRRLPDAKIYIGKNRTLLAKQAVDEGAEIIFLDDGFQHRQLERDIDVVLLSAEDPFGKKQFLPFGFLRDDPKRLHQADALFVKDRDFRLSLHRICDEKGGDIAAIREWKVGLFCGIANPASFRKMVTSLGAKVVAEWILADHAPASPVGLEAFAERCKSLGARALVTTEKDFTKSPRASLPILCIEV